MITVKASTNIAPSALMNKVVQALPPEKKNVFQRMVETAVNLQAKNTKNLASKDLARYQVADLAKKYSVTILWS